VETINNFSIVHLHTVRHDIFTILIGGSVLADVCRLGKTGMAQCSEDDSDWSTCAKVWSASSISGSAPSKMEAVAIPRYLPSWVGNTFYQLRCCAKEGEETVDSFQQTLNYV
jgi:hypothetical protein